MSDIQLFCFTYAGGTSAFFDEIEKELNGIAVIKPEYAGHGVRHNEPFYKNFDELADDIFNKFRTLYNGGKYGLFGYSMGSITLVEVLKRIINSEMRVPSNIFLAAHEPHTKSELSHFSSDELDEMVKLRTIRFGAVPEKLLNNQVFWRTYLPIYRVDYSLIGTYDFEELNLKADIPATVFYSETDTPLERMKQWERFFPCCFYQFQGTHFFIRQHYQKMAEIIKSKME